MLEKILRLRNEWQRNFPRKAEGGVSALTGFNYQFGVFLLNLLEKWTTARQTNEPIPPPKSFIESVSDIADLSDDDILYVTQVKLNPATDYHKIFDEFWDIFNLAKRVIPGAESSLRFILCTSTGPVPDLQKKFKSWAKTTQKPALRATELESMILSKYVPEPHDRILGILANELHDTKPSDHLFSWLGRLLAASSQADFDSVIKRIWEDFVEIANNKEIQRNPIYVWQASDRPPSQISTGGFLTGEQPRPAHLRNGFFAPRPAVYNDLVERFSQWWQSHYQASDCSLRLPVFWIGGRSGSGKSVALLHLLAHIHSQGNTHIFWIGPNVNLLRDAIQWATVLREQGREAVVAVDDPFAPATQDDAKVWKDALASIESLRCEGEITGMPVLLCCGPTEHALKLEQAHPDDVSVQKALLPVEQQSDVDELRAWYRQRTGTEAPDVGDENVLLVQLFFQWRSKVTLPEFAKRFQDRINEADPEGNLHNIFSRVLAANRLYLGYPQAAFENSLSASLYDAVDQLKREHHIADMGMGRDGVWLAHPHLSNAIYEWWYPSDSRVHARETHLAVLINDALRYGESPREKTAPLWAVSRSVSSRAEEEPFVGRLDYQTVSHILPNIFRQRIETSGGQLSVSELPVWIQIRATFPEILLSPDPFELALNKLQAENTTDVGLRLTCHKLLEYQDSMSPIQIAAFANNLATLLKTTIHSWREWPHVATDAYKRTGDKTTESLLVEWIKLNEKKSIAHRILLDLLHADLRGAALDNAAAASLAQQSDDSMIWSDIAKQIIRRSYSENAVRSVCEWASLHSKEFRTGFLLAEMVRGRIPEAVNLALEWAQIWHKERSANWVLEALCEQSAPDRRVRDWCITWLSHDYPQSNPGFLAEKLIRAYPADSVVRQNILLWLQQVSPSRTTWFYVWDAAFTAAPGDSRLITLGIDALELIRPEHRFWLTFWQKLWHETRYNKRLIDIGLNWLRHMPMNKLAWIAVWNMLWHATGGTSELVEIGLEWLNINTRSRAWGGLWGRFWKLHHGDNRLVLLAQKWLSHNLWQWNVWFAVWQEVWQTNREDETAYDLAHRWLSMAPLSLPSWLVVWEIVWHYDGADDDLRALGLKWLRNTEQDHGAWQRVWAYLWTDKQGDRELINMGHEWLKSIAMSHGSWPKMWKDLWSLDKNNAMMIQRGIEWVNCEKNFGHGDWQHNWKELVQVRKEDDSLTRIGAKWLRVTPSYNNYWVDVWMFLSKRTPMTSSMLDMAKRWLLQTSPSRNKWPNLWLKIQEERADTDALRRKVKTYVETNPMDAEWYRLWASLHIPGGDNKEIDELGLRWLLHMLQKRPSSQNWHQVWATLWETTPGREKLASQAIQWLQRVSPDDTAWHKIWCAIQETQPGRADIMKIGRDWLQKAKPHHQGWYQVWHPLFQNNKSDRELLKKAVTWLESAPGQHLSWGDMWLTLYHHGESKEALESIAQTWLAQTASLQKSHSWPTIWRLLWDSDKLRDRLLISGIEWLRASPHSKVWTEVFDPLWNSGKGREVLQDIDAKRRLINHTPDTVDEAIKEKANAGT